MAIIKFKSGIIGKVSALFDCLIAHFVDCILEDRESHCSVADAYRSHELYMAIDRVLEQGGPVPLPLNL